MEIFDEKPMENKPRPDENVSDVFFVPIHKCCRVFGGLFFYCWFSDNGESHSLYDETMNVYACSMRIIDYIKWVNLIHLWIIHRGFLAKKHINISYVILYYHNMQLNCQIYEFRLWFLPLYRTHTHKLMCLSWRHFECVIALMRHFYLHNNWQM